MELMRAIAKEKHARLSLVYFPTCFACTLLLGMLRPRMLLPMAFLARHEVHHISGRGPARKWDQIMMT